MAISVIFKETNRKLKCSEIPKDLLKTQPLLFNN